MYALCFTRRPSPSLCPNPPRVPSTRVQLQVPAQCRRGASGGPQNDYAQGMTLNEYISKWGSCSLPVILGLGFDHIGWVENYNHTQLVEQLKEGDNDSGWSLYTACLRPTLPFDRGPCSEFDNTSHASPHTQEGLHSNPTPSGLAADREVTSDETTNSTVSPTCSTARTNPIRLRTCRQRLRRTIVKHRKRVMCEL